MDHDLKPGVYKHFKGGLYEIIGVAMHTETEERFVVYKPLDGEYAGLLRCRPYDMFAGLVERDGYSGPRFVLTAASD